MARAAPSDPSDPLDPVAVVDRDQAAAALRACVALAGDAAQPPTVRDAAQQAAEAATQVALADGVAHAQLAQLRERLVALQRRR